MWCKPLMILCNQLYLHGWEAIFETSANLKWYQRSWKKAIYQIYLFKNTSVKRESLHKWFKESTAQSNNRRSARCHKYTYIRTDIVICGWRFVPKKLDMYLFLPNTFIYHLIFPWTHCISLFLVCLHIKTHSNAIDIQGVSLSFLDRSPR